MPLAIPIIITLGLGIFPFFTLGAGLLTTTGLVLGFGITGTVAILGMPLSAASLVNNILMTVMSFLFATT